MSFAVQQETKLRKVSVFCPIPQKVEYLSAAIVSFKIDTYSTT